MNAPRQSFMDRKRDELVARGIDPSRLPAGQYLTDRFPVLHIGDVPADRDPSRWTLTVGGDAVAAPRTWTWDELHTEFATTELTADIHCVTKWSRVDVPWRGVDLHAVLAASRPTAEATTLLAWGAHDYSANLALADLVGRPALIAWDVDGAPLEPEHGAPLRLVVPHRYFWKSVKWLDRLELWSDTRVGFWEDHGYHHTGDPFAEQRYWGDDR